jgi:hypothetical protein
VFAQTLPERNASHRILEKLGFEAVGTINHPEDGEVLEWQWKKMIDHRQRGNTWGGFGRRRSPSVGNPKKSRRRKYTPANA